MSKLQFVDWKLYEKKSQISETGGGISLQPQTWRLLEHNGVAGYICAGDFFRSADGQAEQVRNGRSGKLLVRKHHLDNTPPHHQSCRLVRAKLQTALLKNVNQSHIHVGKKLTKLEHLPSNRVRIFFEDGYTDEADLLIGADGIRSYVRKSSFPDHAIHYTGQTAYRTVVSKARVKKINGIPWVSTFWKHVSGMYVFTSPLGDDDFEVTARIRQPKEGQDHVSWGQSVDFHTLLHEYNDFCLPVRQILHLAAQEQTQEFALFSGPRLQRVSSHGNIALIGDASHPLSGNFGAGAGFAMEDVYALSKVLEWAWLEKESLVRALDLFDSVRSPHYERLYKAMDKYASIKADVLAKNLTVDEEIEERVKRIYQAAESWMYSYEINKVVDGALRQAAA